MALELSPLMADIVARRTAFGLDSEARRNISVASAMPVADSIVALRLSVISVAVAWAASALIPPAKARRLTVSSLRSPEVKTSLIACVTAPPSRTVTASNNELASSLNVGASSNGSLSSGSSTDSSATFSGLLGLLSAWLE